MRLDRLREGLLGEPLLPGGTHDARPYPYTAPAQTPNVTEAIGSAPAIADLNFLKSISPMQGEIHPGLTTEYAQGKLRGAMAGAMATPVPIKPQPSPPMRETLSQLSDLTQGKSMGRMIPETPPMDALIAMEGDDLPDRPQEGGTTSMSDAEMKEAIEGMLKEGPLQKLRYRDGGSDGWFR